MFDEEKLDALIDPTSPVEEPIDVGTSMTAEHKSVRRRFINEYMKDRDAEKALGRIGYGPMFAKAYAVRFMQEPYTLWYLQQTEEKAKHYQVDENRPETVKSVEDIKQTIITGLMKEAHNTGKGSSHTARVSALAKLAAIYQLETPKKVAGQDANAPIGSGQIIVPGLMTPEQWVLWQEQAQKQQEELPKRAAESNKDAE